MGDQPLHVGTLKIQKKLFYERNGERNLNSYEKYIEYYLGQTKDSFIRESLLSDAMIDSFQENMLPIETEIAYYRCAIMEIETKFKVLNEQFSLRYDRNPIETIKCRLKSMESILKKIRRKNIPLRMDAIEEALNDIAGVRVICAFPEDIYMLADCLLQQDDIRLIERKDYIKEPKSSGYRSLHLIVEVPIFLENEKRPMKVEVQLRTIAMDFWASLEHKLRYKKNIPNDEVVELANELRDCAEISAMLDRRMESIRNRMNTPEFKSKMDAQKKENMERSMVSMADELMSGLNGQVLLEQTELSQEMVLQQAAELTKLFEDLSEE